jgi:hypothetical protein
VQVRALPGSPFGRTATWCGIPSRKRVGFGLGGSTPSPSAFRSGVVERQDARLLIAKRRFDPCHRSSRSKSGSASPSHDDFDRCVVSDPALCGRRRQSRHRHVGRPRSDVWLRVTAKFARPCGRNGMTPDSQSGSCGFESRRGCLSNWTVDGRSKGVTEQRLTPKRCVGRNVHPASLRGEGISLAVHDGDWQACRRATDGNGKRSEQRAAPFEGSKSLLPHHR